VGLARALAAEAGLAGLVAGERVCGGIAEQRQAYGRGLADLGAQQLGVVEVAGPDAGGVVIVGAEGLDSLKVLQQEGFDTEDGGATPVSNEFSGKGFRLLNFVADLPVRVDSLLPSSGKADSRKGEG
jgi:hypothetical protein